MQEIYRACLKTELDNLLIKIDIKDNDIIAPIARKGIRVLELSDESKTLFEKGQILYYETIKMHAKELKKKRIVLFDESVNFGNTLRIKKDELWLLSRQKNLGWNIETSALLVNENLIKEYPRYYSKNLVCDQNLYDNLSDQLMYKILSSGRPLDVDHLIISIDISNNNLEDLPQKLKEYFNAKELAHSGHFNGIKMFTIDCNHDFNIPYIDGHPLLFDEGPKKIRLFLKDNILRLVPIIFPALEISKLKYIKDRKKICKLYEMDQECALCKVLNIESNLKNKNFERFKELHDSICYTCVVNELNCQLIGLFLKQFINIIDFKFLKLEKESLFTIYHKNEGKLLTENYERKIKSISEGEEIPSLSSVVTKKCIIKNLTPIHTIFNSDPILSRMRPEIRVAMAIRDYKNVNKDVLAKAEYSVYDIEPDGLSYNQIFDLMSDELNYDKISEGMDIGLDIGYIKPILTTKGIKVKCDGENLVCIIRLYRPTSEKMDKSLIIFSNLVMGKGIAYGEC